MTIVLALLPIFLLIVVGYALKRADFPGMAFWPPAEKLLYYVLFPALLIDKLTHAQYPPTILASASLVIPLTLALVSLGVWLFNRLRPVPGPALTSLYQGSIRFNSYLGLAAVQSLEGDDGVAVVAVCMAIMIPWVNVLCILVFDRVNPQRSPGWWPTCRTILQNPLIIGCVIGLAGNLSGFEYPKPVRDLMGYLGNMALPLGLLCVGAALQLKAVGSQRMVFISACMIKLLLVPLMYAGVCVWLGASQPLLVGLVIIGSLPTATASYILARQLGGDAPLMAAIISAQTLLAMLTMPLIIPVAMSLAHL